MVKQEYFASSFVEVKAFFRSQYGTYNGHIKRRTEGWAQEKKELVKGIVEKSIELTYQNKSVELSETLEGIIKELQLRATVAPQNLNIRELKLLWEMFMFMNKRSTKNIPQKKSAFEENEGRLTEKMKQNILRLTGCDEQSTKL